MCAWFTGSSRACFAPAVNLGECKSPSLLQAVLALTTHVSYSLNSLKGVIWGIIYETTVRVIRILGVSAIAHLTRGSGAGADGRRPLHGLDMHMTVDCAKDLQEKLMKVYVRMQDGGLQEHMSNSLNS